MNTIALRFGEHFSPESGTISEHQKIIDTLGYVWYGKLGSKISSKVISEIMQEDTPKILLINSGKTGRYWAYITDVSEKKPELKEYPEYYREKSENMKVWFKINRFEKAPDDILAKCVVSSSGKSLSEASKQSMSPYFKTEYKEGC